VTLREIIEQEIADKGPIPFSRYMELCLYHPQLGYYSRNAEQFGKAGDFFTSSDVHAVFGRLLARQFEEIWRLMRAPARIEILELGPGRGLFARDVLDWCEKKFPEFFRAMHYVLSERSPSLQEKIRENLSKHFHDGKAVLSAASSPVPGSPVIIFANEFFDAIPVEVLSSQGQLYIDSREGSFTEQWRPASPEVEQYMERYGVRPERHERLEAPLAASDLMKQLAGTMDYGVLLAVDYGYTRQEQEAGRHRGTLKAIRQHSVNANPYEAPGEQDITADVNFTALAAAAEDAGITVQPLRTQSQFLMGIGERNQFADAFEECRLPQERAKVALQLKHLVTPAGMGESFHVLLGSKGMDPAEVAKLSGLSFGAAAPRL
jgi:SAM-dependent MidA family methyltransferase